MPSYSYRCQTCGATDEVLLSMRQAKPKSFACTCGGAMRRDFRADLPRVHLDADFCSADYDENVGFRNSVDMERSKASVTNNSLSRTLARVPGIPKYRDKNGRVYAAFRNQKHRKQCLAAVGMPEAG